VPGDSVYGADYALRRTIETSGRGYVLAVTSAQHLGCKPVVDWLEDVPARAWRRLSAGEGAKGPRLYEWAYLPYRSETAPGWQKGLLSRRCAQADASVKIGKPDKFTFYLTLSPETMTLPALVRIAGTRWTIEACFEEAKGEVGLDHYEVRSWTGWHRHITLAMLAHAYLTVVRHAAARGRGHRPTRDGSAALHRARSATPPLASALGAPAQSCPDPGVVDVASPPPAAR
jgi:SRSO17 transposase